MRVKWTLFQSLGNFNVKHLHLFQHNTGTMNNKSNNPPSAAELIELSTAEILDDNTMSGLIGLQNSMLKHSQASLSSDQDYIPFAKDICGRYIVLYTFIARDENDVSVERGEFVTGKLLKRNEKSRKKLAEFHSIQIRNLSCSAKS